MTRPPDQLPESARRTGRQEAAREGAPEAAAQHRDHRRRGGPPAAVAGRRWRFANAVAAARELSSGNATAG